MPGLPHHVTQRGNRRQTVFFEDGDYRAYLKLIRAYSERFAVEILAYCLMPNHVHLVVVPPCRDSLAKLFGTAHHRHALRVNERFGWSGHLWQERFHSSVLDEPHMFAALRYVELNPVRANLCNRAQDWPWSSARGHLGISEDVILDDSAWLAGIDSWSGFLAEPGEPSLMKNLRVQTMTGRPSGDRTFIRQLERITGRRLRKQNKGPRPR